MRRLLALSVIVLVGCAAPLVRDQAGDSRVHSEISASAHRSRLGDVMPAPPGAINEDVTEGTIDQTICVPGWAATVRPSSSYTNGVKAKLLREHGLTEADAVRFELDHLIPLALGGHPRKIENLWLQAWDGDWGARRKDQLEVRLKNLVCAREVSLAVARKAIAADWRAAWARYVGAGQRELVASPVE